MRPLKIELNNFGPFEDSIIDFNHFNVANLFLISGDTGAGKTTIFDGMTYALFGDKDIDRPAKDMRSKFADGNLETAVTFWFEHNGKYYKVTRTPEQELLKKSAKSEADTTKKGATAQFAEVDETLELETVALGSKLNDVNNAVSELLHLNAKQFRQIIVLPQNQFRKFLGSASDDKADILRTLFGTQIYEEFTAQLKAQQKDQSTEINDKKKELSLIFKGIDWQTTEYHEDAPIDDKFELANQKIKQNKDGLDALTIKVANAEKERVASQQDQNAAQQLDFKFKQLTETQQQADELEIQNAEILQDRQAKQHIEWLRTQLTLVDESVRLTTENTEIELTQSKLNTEQSELKEQDLKIKQENQEINAKQAEYEQAKQHSRTIELELLPNAQELENQQLELKKTDDLLLKLKAELAESNKIIEDNRKQQLANVELLATMPTSDAAQLQLNRVRTGFNELRLASTAFKSVQQDLENSERKISAQKETVNDAEEQLKIHNAEFEVAKLKRQSLMIELLQSELKEGEPCSVCGVIYDGKHANHTTVNQDDIRAQFDEVENIERIKNEASSALAVARDGLNNLSADYKKMFALSTEKNVLLEDEYDKFMKTWDNEYHEQLAESYDEQLIESKLINHEQLVEKKVKQRLDIETEQIKLNQLIDQQQSDVVEFNQKIAIQDNLNKAVQQIISGINKKFPELQTVEELNVNLNDLNQLINGFETKLKQFQNNETKYKTQLASWHTSAEALKSRIEKFKANNDLIDIQVKSLIDKNLIEDIESLTEEVNLIRDGVKLSDLTSKIVAYETKVQSTQEKLTYLSKELLNQQVPDLEAIEVEAKQKDAIWAELQTSLADVKAAYSTIVGDVQKAEKLANDIELAESAGKAINDLFNAVNGNNAVKMDLERFVLRNFLNEVLNFANEHYIGQLSAGRYQFRLSAELSGHANQNGLDIEIFDGETNTYRPTVTLSGGESFIAALSIALSMAEVVQAHAGGASIEALFIDEGFGTLDSQTLDQAMEALSSLESTGRLIGVISHVESMKREIEQQILIKKQGDGRSIVQYTEL